MSELEPTDSFDEPRPQLRRVLRDASHALVCLDFDGTLAPIVDEPQNATMTPDIRDALSSLACDPAVTTAVVSGRELADVRDRVSLPVIYAGNHGLELYRDGSISVHPIARKRAPLVDDVCLALETALDPFPNCRIENKRLTGTVHVRSVPRPAHERIRQITRGVVDRIGDGELETSPGKRIVEFSPTVPWGKGDAVSLLETACPDDTAVVYVGDDVTDESAFQEVEPEDVGIYVGRDGDSIASCRVRSPAEVATLLGWLADSGVDLLTEPRFAESPVVSVAGSD